MWIARGALGPQWPLTAEIGRLLCEVHDGAVAVSFETGGTRYALKSAARELGYPAADPIWADRDAGGKKALIPLIDIGRKLCGEAAPTRPGLIRRRYRRLSDRVHRSSSLKP